MATTTNYGWTTPDDTALVKDGAAAIRTLGTSIDTTTKALNPSTTLGDIEYRSSTANTNTRLGIGSTGNVLTVTGGVPVWAAPASGGGMTLISTTTLSGATTTLSSIPQTYNSLFLVITGMTANTSSSLFKAYLNGSATNHSYTATFVTSVDSPSNQKIELSPSQTLRTSADNIWTLTVNNYTSTTSYKTFNFTGRYITSASVNQTPNGGGAFTDVTAVTSIVFEYGGTNTFAGGTVLLYGVK